MEQAERIADQIVSFVENKKRIKLEELDKKIEKLSDSRKEQDASKLADLKEKRQKCVKEHVARNWIADAARRAPQLALATHPAKFSNPDSKGTSICDKAVLAGELDTAPYLTTASMKSIEFDVSGNAAALDVGKFLRISNGEFTLIEELARGETATLERFAADKAEAQQWRDSFTKVLRPPKQSSHTLSKQIYWPVGESYRIISPLLASSLSDQVVKRVDFSKYSDEQKSARDARRNQKGSSTLVTMYPSVLTMNFGGTKPQNISILNRSNGLPRFSSKPPTWNKEESLSLEREDAFWIYLKWRSKSSIRKLQSFIRRSAKMPNKKEVRLKRQTLLGEVVDMLFTSIFEIRGMYEIGGWSDRSKLPKSECFLLDPEHPDEKFQKARAIEPWSDKVFSDYSRWLMKSLEHSKLRLSDSEYQEIKTEVLHQSMEQLNFL